VRIIHLGLILIVGWGLLAHSAAYGQTNAPASVQAPAESLSESGKKAAPAGEKVTAGTPSPAKTAASFDWWDLLKIVGGAFLGILIKAIFDLFALRKASERKIVETMTTKLHEYAEKYYMACVNQAKRAKRNIETYTTLPATPPTPQQPHDTESALRALHAIALLYSKLNKSKREIGGVFLATRTGEAIVSALEGEITPQITKSGLTIEDVLQIVALVEPDAGKDAKDVRDVTFLAFRKAAADDAVKELCEKWRAWLGAKGKEVADLVLILSCYSQVLLYEVNRTYEAWYGQRESPFMESQELTLMVKMIKEHTPVSRARVRYLKHALKGCTERSLRKNLIRQART